MLHGVELPHRYGRVAETADAGLYAFHQGITAGTTSISAPRGPARSWAKRPGGRLEAISLAVYKRASEYAAERGVIIADTKFEIGELDGRMILIDEVADAGLLAVLGRGDLSAGQEPAEFRQAVRAGLSADADWDQTYPGPELPAQIVEKTAEKYREAYSKIVGKEL